MKRRIAKNFLNLSWRLVRPVLVISGCVFCVMMVLAFTSAPFRIWYSMGMQKAGIHRPPDLIVVMGGSGMPGESGLLRCWYAAGAAGRFPGANVIVALPGDVNDTLSSVNQMKKELELRGIAGHRVYLEGSGTNTREQALNIVNQITDYELRITNDKRIRHSSIVNRKSSILIVTSPEHLLRAVLTFRKAGFISVDGLPAFEQAIESDIRFDAAKLGGRMYIPDIGTNITLRYQFWTQMNYELLVLREWTALAYYKLKGWI